MDRSEELAGADHGGIVLLPSKTNRPVTNDDAVRRSRVVHKLSFIVQRAVTVVTAPAGFGKTTAVAAWASNAELPVAWCSLDEDDADPVRLWNVVAQALGTIGGDTDFSAVLSEVDWADTSRSHDALVRLLSSLSGFGPVVLVIEDFHVVQDATIVTENMAYFLRRLPANVHVVITSRTPVRLPLAKMRASGMLNEVGEIDLRMTAEEQALFFSRLGIDLASEDIARIDEATQGWPAGCRLVGLCCGDGSASAVAQAVAVARDNVNDYLFEEVLASLDSELLRFMVETSVADAFSVDLAAHVSELSRADAQRHLDVLVAQGLFVQRFPGADGEDWYRYHQMLLELLRTRLKRLPEEIFITTASRAREWFLEHGFDDAAVGLSFWMRDWEGLCDLIMTRWKYYFMNDGHATILRWMDLLPPELLGERPFLCAVSALPYALSGDTVKSHEMIQRALVQLKGDGDFLYAFCVSQRALLAAIEGKGDEARVFATRALEYLPKSEDYLRAMMIQTVAGALCRTDPMAAKEAFLGALAIQRSFGDRNVICSAYANLAVLCSDMGQISESEGYCAQALGLYDQDDWKVKPMLGFVHRARAACAYERGDGLLFDGACADYDALRQAGAVSIRSAELMTLRAKMNYAARRPGEGRAEFARALAQDRGAAISVAPSLPMIADWCADSRAEALAVSGRIGDELTESLFHLGIAYCLDDVACYEKVLSFVDAVDPRNFSLRVRALTLAAAFAEKVARQRQGVEFLREAYDIASEHGLMVAFLENAPMVRGLIPRLRSELDRDGADGASIAEDRAIAALLEECLAPVRRVADALTERELDVLRSVADGASVAEAAQALVVSRETVKKHLGNIYTKLGVHSKMAAVALLREEGTL